MTRELARLALADLTTRDAVLAAVCGTLGGITALVAYLLATEDDVARLRWLRLR